MLLRNPLAQFFETETVTKRVSHGELVVRLEMARHIAFGVTYAWVNSSTVQQGSSDSLIFVVANYQLSANSKIGDEPGAVVNMLALVERPPEGSKVICLNTLGQVLFLDNHATVAEAVANLKKEMFQVQRLLAIAGRWSKEAMLAVGIIK